MSKILVVDDEVPLLETLRLNLERQQHDVVAATTGSQAIRLARQVRPDLIILDVMLPEMDGFEVCRILRGEMATPILMLTAREDQADKIVGLELGADDYLTKPFHLRELLARVKAMLRRTELSRQQSVTGVTDELVAGDIAISVARHRVTLGGEEISLRPKEFDLLAHLVRHPGLALTREQLLDAVWGHGYPGDVRTVDVHVRWLREKIEADPAHPRHIETVRGIGYRFAG